MVSERPRRVGQFLGTAFDWLAAFLRMTWHRTTTGLGAGDVANLNVKIPRLSDEEEIKTSELGSKRIDPTKHHQQPSQPDMLSPSPPPPSLTKPVFEHHHDGFGIGNSQPRLSWRFLSTDATAQAWRQTSYEIEITADGVPGPQTFIVESDESVLVPWPAAPLQSRQMATVRVRSVGESENTEEGLQSQSTTPWSPYSAVEVGLLDTQDWTAQLITSSRRIGSDAPLQPLRFYKEFVLPKGSASTLPSKARLYITALGVFEAYVNGRKTSNECMAPGWTSYNHRLSYRVHDVTDLLRQGENSICVEVAEGWYAGQLGIQGGGRFLYGGQDVAVMAQLEIESGDEKARAIVNSDEVWCVIASAIQSSEIYNGETYDAQLERENWTTHIPSEAEGAVSCRHLPWIGAALVAPEAPPVRVVEQVRPVDVFRSRSGQLIVDFGQNLVGKLLIGKVDLPAGHRLSFKHAEVMEHGELGTRPLRSAKCTDTIVSAGTVIRDWAPRFTYHGFRYVQVDGWPSSREDELREQEGLVALVMQSDLRRRGHFECSNDWLNKLHSNVVWSMRGNFFSIPTDCPQRPERLGWTGDLNLFCPTASFLYDTVGFLGDWLQDLSAEQMEESRNGIPPLVVPDVLWTSLFPRNIAQAIWDDATVLVPWTLFNSSSDLRLLERQFESMQAWLTRGLPRDSDGLWVDCWQFGDWLDPTAPPDNPGDARTDGALVADAYLVHVTERMAEICSLLGKERLATQYADDAGRLKKAFQNKYISPRGNLMGDSQTGLALAIQFGLYESQEQVQNAAARLEKLVKKAKFTIATGFTGTPIITHALTRIGLPQLAYRMLLEKTCPSWLYPVTMGATTVWERWNSMLPDGSINPGVMTSFNHYALGAVADWMHGTVGGISPLTPGWKTIRVRPIPGGNLTSAAVSFDGPYGLISCRWRLEETGAFKMTLVVPPNSKASVILPTGGSLGLDVDVESATVVASGTHHFRCQCTLDAWPPAKYIPPFLPKPVEETIAE